MLLQSGQARRRLWALSRSADARADVASSGLPLDADGQREELEGFGMGKIASFALTSEQSGKKRAQGKCVSGIYELKTLCV